MGNGQWQVSRSYPARGCGTGVRLSNNDAIEPGFQRQRVLRSPMYGTQSLHMLREHFTGTRGGSAGVRRSKVFILVSLQYCDIDCVVSKFELPAKQSISWSCAIFSFVTLASLKMADEIRVDTPARNISIHFFCTLVVRKWFFWAKIHES